MFNNFTYVILCATVVSLFNEIRCDPDPQPGPSNPVVKKLFGVESNGNLLLPAHNRLPRNAGYGGGRRGNWGNTNNCNYAGCNTGCQNCNTGCNQPNCNRPNVVVNTCVWQYQCYTKNVCDSCGNSNQMKVCQWKCNNYCQNYVCG